MKIFFSSLLMGIALLLSVIDSRGQSLLVVPTDTLPAIKMKFEPAYIIVYLVVPATALFLGGHSYKIREEMKIMPSSVQPYFAACGDSLVLDHYQKQKNYRTGWYATSGAGAVVFVIGFAHAIASIFDSGNARAANGYLLLGSGLFLTSVGLRIACFRNMRKAVNLYNYQCANPSNAVSLNLGLPSSTPAGLGLYVKF